MNDDFNIFLNFKRFCWIHVAGTTNKALMRKDIGGLSILEDQNEGKTYCTRAFFPMGTNALLIVLKGKVPGVKGKVVNSSPFILPGWRGGGGLYGKGCNTIHRIFKNNPTKSNL